MELAQSLLEFQLMLRLSHQVLLSLTRTSSSVLSTPRSQPPDRASEAFWQLESFDCILAFLFIVAEVSFYFLEKVGRGGRGGLGVYISNADTPCVHRFRQLPVAR